VDAEGCCVTLVCEPIYDAEGRLKCQSMSQAGYIYWKVSVKYWGENNKQ